MALIALLSAAAASVAASPATVAALIAPLVVLLAARWWKAATLDLYKLPNAPGTWTFLGILPDYWRHHDVAALQLKYMEDAKAGPFLRCRAAHKVVVMVADPAAAAEIFSRSGPNRVERKVPEYANFDIATGLHGHHSILTEQNEPRWIAVRKALAPAYGAAAIRDNWPWIINTYRTMGRRIAAAIDAAAAADGSHATATLKPAARPIVTAVAGRGSDSSEDEAGSEVAAAPQIAAGVSEVGADVHIDHLALAASIQMQAEGLFRMPPDKKSKIDDLQDALWFILMMLIIGMCFYVWSIVLLVRMGATPGMIALKYLDLITVAVPPALVACLAIATAAAVARLWRGGVSVSSSGHINLAGLVDTVAFDKTGTLTESGLELRELRLATNSRFHAVTLSCGSTAATPAPPPAAEEGGGGAGCEEEGAPRADGGGTGPSVDVPRAVRVLLAACHGLAVVEGALAGDQLEIKLFEASGWSCLGEQSEAASQISVGAAARDRQPEEGAEGAVVPGEAGKGAGGGMVVVSPCGERCRVVRRFDFTSARQRSSVVVAHGDASLAVYAKGSPEVVRDLCVAGVPEDFDAQLQATTQAGLRAIALAHRALPAGTASSEVANADEATLENGLCFDGFALLENPLKPDSADAIAQLKRARMQVLMASGDHVLTAVKVAQQCGILDLDRPAAVITAAPPSAGGGLECAVVGADGARAPSALRNAVRGVAEGALQCAVTGAALRVLHQAAALQTDRAAKPDVLPGLGAMLQLDEISDADGPSSPTAAAAIIVKCEMLPAAVNQNGSKASCPAAPEMVEMGSWLQVVLSSCSVYARMTPGDKALLMELLGPGEQGGGGDDGAAALPGVGRTVAFCGDGANDTGALRASLVGLSLCQAEASIAAPLTSRAATVQAMVAVIAEGRCSLAAAYAIFRFIMSYALIQVFGICLVYMYGITIGNYQYLIQDLFFATVLAGFMSATPPCRRLSAQRPPPCLMSAAVILPVAAHCVTIGVFQVAALLMLGREPWYTRFDTTEVGVLTESMAPENTVVFNMNIAQIWISCLALNIGRPFRAPIWRNRPLVAVLVIQLALILYCVFSPVDYLGSSNDPIMDEFAQLVGLPMSFRGKLFALIAGNAAASYLTQILVRKALAAVPRLLAWRLLRGDIHSTGTAT